jgi:hypothetical protein
MKHIGRRENIDLPELGGYHVEAKIDTGAFRTAIHCEFCRVVLQDNMEVLEVGFIWAEGQPLTLSRFTHFRTRTVKNSFGQAEERYSVRTLLKLGTKRIQSDVTFTDRSGMKYPVLLGRKTIGRKFLVDVSHVNLLTSKTKI